MRFLRPRAYEWVDPFELVEIAEEYTLRIEDAHRGEKRRMYEAMAAENYQMRKAQEFLADQLAKVMPNTQPVSFIITAEDAARRGLKF